MVCKRHNQEWNDTASTIEHSQGLRPDVSVRSSFQETFEQESDVYVQSASLRESESESDDKEDPNSYVNDC